MKTLTITNQKGGVGKTALVVNLALNFAARGIKTAVLDMDIQGNCSFSLKQYGEMATTSAILLGETADFPKAKDGISLFPADNRLITAEKYSIEAATENLRHGLHNLSTAGYAVCLLDSPAAPGTRFMAGLLTADFILAPIELEAYSIQGIANLMTTIGNIRKINRNACFLGMLANKVDKRTPRHIRNLEQLSKVYPQALLPMSIGLRGSIAEALVTGKPIWENRKTAARTAARELEAVADYIFDKMQLSAEK